MSRVGAVIRELVRNQRISRLFAKIFDNFRVIGTRNPDICRDEHRENAILNSFPIDFREKQDALNMKFNLCSPIVEHPGIP